MKIISILAIVIIIIVGIGAGWYAYSTSPKLEITSTANIPYHSQSDANTLAVGYGSAGTLYCTGKIIETDQGVESITLIWKADVTFPSNYVGGGVCNGAVTEPTWGKCLSAITKPGYTNIVWWNAKGEHHIWKITETFYADRLLVEWYIDNTLIDSTTFNDGGYLAIEKGYNTNPKYHRIKSAFFSKEDPYQEYTVEIETPEFYLVRQIDDFYFVNNIPITSDGDGLAG